MTRKSIFDRLLGQLPEFKLPELTREVGIPVYLVHNSIDPDDYFFIIDFEDFVERSRQGLFVRPKLKIWAGRDDFSRLEFSRHFREVFAAEFDRMRSEVSKKGGKKGKLGWLNWGDALMLAPNFIGGVIAHIILALALSTGKALFGTISVPKWLKRKSAQVRREADIDETKTLVEKALARIEVALHKELYDHAYCGERLGKISGLDRNAWPLPGHVRAHLSDGKSGSWW